MTHQLSNEILQRLKMLNDFLGAHLKHTQQELEKVEKQRYHSRYLHHVSTYSSKPETPQLIHFWKESLN